MYMNHSIIHIFVFSGPLVLPGAFGAKDSKATMNIGKRIISEKNSGQVGRLLKLLLIIRV